MKINIYQVDAFTDRLFGGNPAAVCPLSGWLSDDILQKIAGENNLSETAFFVQEDERYRIRWFTPTVEVDLCGHATLASAHVIFFHTDYSEEEVRFISKSGNLSVRKNGELLILNFPADEITKVKPPEELIKGIGLTPKESYKGRSDYMLVYDSQKEIEDIKPDFKLILESKARGVIVTAAGNETDFVSRFFAPQSGVPEDPVTGSAHTTLAPYWASVLDKNVLTAAQLSKRKGHLQCTVLKDRVEIAGEAVTYLIGEIYF